jgi:outer membrane protein OmpA-like peptidoglycan-associated protein
MIKKSAVFLLLTFACLTAFSQSFVGYGYDNYSGVNGLLLNPGTLADSKFKVNVNVLAISVLAGNNAYEMDRSRLFGFHLSGLSEGDGFYKSTNTAYKYFYANTDILGPSATINLTSRDALGLITRMRVMGNENNLGDPLFRLTGQTDPAYYNVNIVNRSLQIRAQALAEAGVSYGRVLYKSKTSEFKFGITGKYIAGLAYGSLSSGPVDLEVDPTNTILNVQADVTAQYSGNLDGFGNGESLSNIVKQRGHGWGLDFGFVYELKGEDPTEEKMRLGLSVTDIGSVNYVNSVNSQDYTVTATGANTNQFNLAKGNTLNDYFTSLNTQGLIVSKGTAPTSQLHLPTALHLNADFQIYKRLYINADALLNMLATDNPVSPSYTTTFTATPRLEKKWVSIYSPVSYNVDGQLNWGVGVRVGPVFLGSGSVLSSLLKQRIQTADAHIGMTIPIFQHNKSKMTKADTVYRNITHDRDGDGVVDEKDECPDSAGPIALMGCPDRDGDGVPNYKDSCPDVKGSPNFHGCPAPDTDGDGVNDDEDKCPLVKGVASNHGCPPIKAEYLTTVKRAADRVFFVRAKAVIEPVSTNELDRVVEVLKYDTTLRIRIEGYTDSEGPDEREIKLSERRAHAVVVYLDKHGVNPARMDWVGYGKQHPIAPNETPEGMAQNRRVDMILMNYPKDKDPKDKKKP